MVDPEPDWQPTLDKLVLLKNAWPGGPWSWDSRFAMLASSFAIEHDERARASAALALPHSWDKNTLSTAPPTLRELCAAAGGLRSNQRLLAGRAGPLVLVGLWWPWGNGTTITLRLGLGQYAVDEPPYPAVRTLFGV
jgi:hypothetical protein